jgi:hypothetical protein
MVCIVLRDNLKKVICLCVSRFTGDMASVDGVSLCFLKQANGRM